MIAALQASAEQLQMRVVMVDPMGGRLLLADKTGPCMDVRVWGSDVDATVGVAVRGVQDPNVSAAVDALLLATADLAANPQLRPQPGH